MSRLIALLSLLALPAFAGGKSVPDAGRQLRLVVLYCNVESTDPDLQVFRKGLAAMLITDLAQAEGLTVVERDRLEEAMKELKLGESRYASSSFAKIGKFVGADYVASGTLIRVGKLFTLEMHVFNQETLEEVATMRSLVNDDDVFASEQAVVQGLLKKLGGLKLVAGTETAQNAKQQLPYAVAVKYSKALDAKDKKDKATATKLLGDVVKEAPNFKLAQLDLLSLTK